MGRLFVFALIVWVAYFVVKTAWKSFFPPSAPQRDQTPSPTTDADLIRDPQCGAYFLKSKGIKGIVDGKVIHFCSERCYDRYLKSRSGK